MNTHELPQVSIVIPAYNEEAAIGNILSSLTKFVEDFGWEVIVVNDASEDRTKEIVQQHKHIKLINNPYNKGYGASLKTGIRITKHAYIVTMDADGQHDPNDIFRLLEYIGEFDMVVGSRENQKTRDWLRIPGKLMLTWTANYLAGMKIPDINSGFRLIRRSCIEEFMHILPNSFSFSTTITLALIKAGYNVKYVPITLSERSGGKSRVKQAQDGFAAILLITRCISLFNPLKIYAPIGGALLVFSILFSIYGMWFYGNFPRTGIVTFLAGDWPRESEISPAHCRDIGAAAARLHLAGADFPARRANDLSVGVWRRLYTPLAALAEDLRPAFSAWIEDELAFLEPNWPTGLPAGTVHTDMFPDNVFFKDGALSGVIDFYFACTDTLAIDLAVCLNAWCFRDGAKFDPGRARALFDGYQAVRPLETAERDALPVLARGMAMRFLLTRLHDWFHTPEDALTRRKDPLELVPLIEFHRSVPDSTAYGVV